MQNSFYDISVENAVGKAVGSMRQRRLDHFRVKQVTNHCSDIILSLADAKSRAREVTSKAEATKREIDLLKRSALAKTYSAVAEALVAASGHLGTAIRTLRILAQLNKGNFSMALVRQALPLLAAMDAARNALGALSDLREISSLKGELESLVENGESLGTELLTLASKWERHECSGRPGV